MGHSGVTSGIISISGILRPQVGSGMRGLRHVWRDIAVKVCKLLTSMIVVLAGSMITAWHIEWIRRRPSCLRSIGIRMCTMHDRTLFLRMLWLCIVKVLIVAVFRIIFLLFVMGLVVANTLWHGPAWRLRVISTHMHLFAWVPSHRTSRPPRAVMLVGHKWWSLVQRNSLLLWLLVLLLLCLSRTAPVRGVTLRETCVFLHYWRNLTRMECLKVWKQLKHRKTRKGTYTTHSYAIYYKKSSATSNNGESLTKVLTSSLNLLGISFVKCRPFKITNQTVTGENVISTL